MSFLTGLKALIGSPTIVSTVADTVKSGMTMWDNSNFTDQEKAANVLKMTDAWLEIQKATAGENSLKLAMIGSLLKHGCDCSEIDGDAVEWAKKIVWSSIENMLYRIGQEMTENQDDEMMKKIVSKIRDGGKDFLTRKELFLKMKLKARVLDEYLDSMVENGMIHTAIKMNQNNQAVKIYTV